MKLTALTATLPGDPGFGWPDQCLSMPKLGLLVVADVVGGGVVSRGAVRMALDAIRAHVDRNADLIDRFAARPTPELRSRLLALIEDGIHRAAQETYAFARRREGVIITLDLVIIVGNEAFVGHIGCGRTYLVRGGLVHQLTVDHAQVGDDGVLVVRGLGPEPRVNVECLCMELAHQDRLVLVTSATHGAVGDDVLNDVLVKTSAEELGATLRDAGGGAAIVMGCTDVQGVAAREDTDDRLLVLRPMKLLKHCSERELRVVANATRPRRYRAGSTLFRKGDPGTELFLLVQGSVEVRGDEGVLATLGPGSSFGEMAMLDSPSRSATISAKDACEVLVIPRETFFRLLRGNSSLAVKILWNMLLRLSANLRSSSDELEALQRALSDAKSE
ncbi:MAG: CRP-like cAMP-binding protein [Kiritimatiellia bacterium]|jgi:CRP-like cAMP-binding protein